MSLFTNKEIYRFPLAFCVAYILFIVSCVTLLSCNLLFLCKFTLYLMMSLIVQFNIPFSKAPWSSCPVHICTLAVYASLLLYLVVMFLFLWQLIRLSFANSRIMVEQGCAHQDQIVAAMLSNLSSPLLLVGSTSMGIWTKYASPPSSCDSHHGRKMARAASGLALGRV